jgi:hypothetical protein
MPKPTSHKRLRDGANDAPSAEQAYYNRLMHQCRKDLSKQLKVCKSFECQKLIRKIKLISQEKESSATEKMQTTYESLKAMSIEPILYESLRRLGVLQLNPNKLEIEKIHEVCDSKWTEKLLEHKRMQQALEQWSDQVTEFRKWCLRRLDREEEGYLDKNTTKGGKPVKANVTQDDMGDVASSLFVQLGDTNKLGGVPEKKNRPGQRARKAKAAAIEAKQKGLPAPEKSLNWREAKPFVRPGMDSHDARSSEHSSYLKDRHHATSNQPHPAPQKAEDETLHPSWQAQKAKKEGIVTFQGKKITFD